MVKQIIQQQTQELIPPELVEKFDQDKELVQAFLDEGYTVKELQASTITHPTKYDPMVSIGDKCIGFWIDSPREGEHKYRNNSRTYQNRFNSKDSLLDSIEDRFP